ncbi:hypothetical protein BC830DRAFT_198980 [Chytriomyces sp. MP71]|nr:hypothetical protein BC830DRAFT_198980 [Chytriomyces sp. MP71]
MVADPRPPSSASAVLSRTHEPPAHSNSSSNRNSNRNSHSLVEHSADDRAARTLLSLLKELGEELGQYIDAVESRNASQAAGSSTTRLFKTDEEAAEEIGSLQTRLEAEKRSHKILKRDMVALESSYTTVLANLKSLNLTIHRLEEQCLAQANETEEAELKAAAVAHDLVNALLSSASRNL